MKFMKILCMIPSFPIVLICGLILIMFIAILIGVKAWLELVGIDLEN